MTYMDGCPRCGGPSCPDDDHGWCHACQQRLADNAWRETGEDVWTCQITHGTVVPDRIALYCPSWLED